MGISISSSATRLKHSGTTPRREQLSNTARSRLEEFLKRLGLSQVEAAQRMAIPLNRLNEVIRGKRGITADTALRLARLLNTSPEFWMNHQTASDLYQASPPWRWPEKRTLARSS